MSRISLLLNVPQILSIWPSSLWILTSKCAAWGLGLYSVVLLVCIVTMYLVVVVTKETRLLRGRHLIAVSAVFGCVCVRIGFLWR